MWSSLHVCHHCYQTGLTAGEKLFRTQGGLQQALPPSPQLRPLAKLNPQRGVAIVVNLKLNLTSLTRCSLFQTNLKHYSCSLPLVWTSLGLK
jgi:hypothetical protein